MSTQELIQPVYYGRTGCTLSVVSSIIGSGIVAIPYAMRLTQSLPAFIGMNLGAVGMLLLSSKMLLMIRSNCKQLFMKDGE